jgi:hypothetical protein
MFEHSYRRRIGSDYAGHVTVEVDAPGAFNAEYTRLTADDGSAIASFNLAQLRELHEAIGEALWLQADLFRPLAGRTVRRAGDDAPVPVVGRVTDQDGEWVWVAWGDDRFDRDAVGVREAADELTAADGLIGSR